MGKARKWSQEDLDYLAEHWGYTPMPALCKALNRSQSGILIKVQRLGLGAFLDSGEYITFNQLVRAVTGTSKSYSGKVKSWVENRGLPVHNKRNNRCTWRVVYLHEFWDWAEKNRAFIDFTKLEPLILGEEPEWVAEQRKKDCYAFATQRKDPWTSLEDSLLEGMLKKYKYGYAELSKQLTRSAGAIQRRICDLGLKERPVRADSHNDWSPADCIALAEGIRAGESYTVIADIVGRSEKAVRGKVYNMYFTENADKIRAMMGAGGWGTGAPVPTIKQAQFLSPHKKEIRQGIAALAGVLAFRRNELGYEPYWQRHMCMKWHETKGCLAGSNDCDACVDFERIRPQYCVRCGATFHERAEAKMCARCRSAKKKQAQRKWARNKRGRLADMNMEE